MLDLVTAHTLHDAIVTCKYRTRGAPYVPDSIRRAYHKIFEIAFWPIMTGVKTGWGPQWYWSVWNREILRVIAFARSTRSGLV